MSKAKRAWTMQASFRLSPQTIALLEKCTGMTPYKITKSSIIARGVVLAFKEMENTLAKEPK